jgi:phenylalanyl-tRNA synthetase beta chain
MMKLSLNWLKDYIDPKLSTEALIERLTMAGLEVEATDIVGGDTVLEIEITPNRPDCLNILGLAREVGAITGKTVKSPKIKTHKTILLKNLIHIENKKECSRYIGTMIRDVQIKDVPQAMKQRLASLGINAINNAVDITNFVLMEIGQPLHVFDYDKLAGGKIIVRRAKAGETIVTLDGVERKLDASILVIADVEKPVAIAGIMGGKATEITASTKNILLESALFDMGIVRRACRTLGLRSDSSYRFERNVNVEGVLTGANRATDLLLQLTGGHLSGRCEIAAKTKSSAPKIKVNISAIESLLGVDVTAPQVKEWLARLGFSVTAKAGTLVVTPPNNRADVGQEVDVIEEIARMIGFDHLPAKMPVIKSTNIPVDKRPREIKNQIRRILTASGVDEIITHNMINSKSLAKCNLEKMPVVRIFNPLTQDQELMRPSMMPSVLQVAMTNINRGQKDLAFFEIGKRYFVDGEKETLAILLTGRRNNDWRASKKDTVEMFDLKGMVERILQSLGTNPDYVTNQWAVLDNSCATSITLNGEYLGSFGRVDQKILNNWDIKNQDVYFAGLHLDEVYPLPGKTISYRPISEFPAIVRDVSLAVKKEIPYSNIEAICRAQGGDILKSVHFIEQYLGDKIQAGYKGLVFSCHYQSNARTLREDEVTTVHGRILHALVHDLSAIRR